jgi:hypothetical protein
MCSPQVAPGIVTAAQGAVFSLTDYAKADRVKLPTGDTKALLRLRPAVENGTGGIMMMDQTQYGREIELSCGQVENPAAGRIVAFRKWVRLSG